MDASSIGMNNVNKKLRALDYALDMIDECDLEADDLFKPVKK